METVLNTDSKTGILKGHTVRDVLMQDVPVIDDNATMKDVACRLLNSPHKSFLVLHQGNPLGIITRQQIVKVLHTDGGRELIGNAANQHLEYVSMDTPLDEAWSRMLLNQKSMMLVLEEGQLKGAIDEQSVEEFILQSTAQSLN